jgi:N-hydroxyarylamine O-acetyltransferase
MTPPPKLDVDAYLDRIGHTGPIELDRDTLEALQRAHLTAVPFENLDVFHSTGVRTDPGWSVDKIVIRHRGGWCFELNGAFSALLRSLGFEVTRMAATVLEGGTRAPTPDHLTLWVDLDRPYLVDVGFGASGPIRPLPLDGPGPHDGGFADFRFSETGPDRILERHRSDGSWTPEYRFGLDGREMSAFEPASQRLQTGPGHFTDAPFATRLLDGGPDRVSLIPGRLTIHRDGAVEHTDVDPSAWDAALRDWFTIRL